MSKNYSFKEQISLINKKYKSSNNIMDIFSEDIDYVENVNIQKIISFFLNKNIEICIVNAAFVKNKYIIDIDKPTILTLQDKFILNEILDKKIEIYNNIFFKKNTQDLIFDTSILNKYYLNTKTINHFSMFIFTPDQSYYFMKRSNNTFLLS